MPYPWLPATNPFQKAPPLQHPHKAVTWQRITIQPRGGGVGGAGFLTLLFPVSVLSRLGLYSFAPTPRQKHSAAVIALAVIALEWALPRDSLAQVICLQAMDPGSQLCLLPTSFPLGSPKHLGF